MKVGCDEETTVDPEADDEQVVAQELFEFCKGVVKDQSLPVIEARDKKSMRLATEALSGLPGNGTGK